MYISGNGPGASRPNSRQRFQTPLLSNTGYTQRQLSVLVYGLLNCDVQLLCDSDGEASIAPAGGGYLILTWSSYSRRWQTTDATLSNHQRGVNRNRSPPFLSFFSSLVLMRAFPRPLLAPRLIHNAGIRFTALPVTAARLLTNLAHCANRPTNQPTMHRPTD